MDNNEESIFNIEPLNDNNDYIKNYLLYNISLLQNYPVTHYNYLLHEVDTQKNLNMLILSEKTKLEQEKKDLLLETGRLKRKITHLEDELYVEENPEKKIKISKYQYFKFNTTKKSYDNEKINETLYNKEVLMIL